MRGSKARHLRRLAALEFAHQEGLPYMRLSDLDRYYGIRRLQDKRWLVLAPDGAQRIYKRLKRKYNVQPNPAARQRERLSSPSGLVWGF
jgi:hypothetical protein